MRIQKIRIENFRSIQELELSLNPKINILVGTNESGKSNILKALTRMDGLNKYPFEEDDISRLNHNQTQNNPEISIKFTLAENENKEFIETTIQTIPKEALTILKNKDLPLLLTPPFSIQYSKQYSGVDFFIVNGRYLEEFGLENEGIKKISDLLLRYVKPINLFTHRDVNFLKTRTKVSDFLKDPDKHLTLKNLLKIGRFIDFNIFNNGFKANSKLQTVARRINDIFPIWWKQDPSIKFFISVDHENYINIHISDSTSSEESPESRSEGVQWFMSFLINFLAKTEGKDNDASVLLFDEFALHIHPNAQKDLLLLLEDFANSNQIIYTTHFPFLIDQNHPERINLVSKKEDSLSFGTKVNLKPYTELWKNLRNEIGVMLSDSFLFSENTLIIEGASELFILRALNNFFKKLNRTHFTAEEVILLPREGKGFNLLQMFFFCKAVNLKVVILVDGDSEEKRAKELLKKAEQFKEENLISLREFLNQSTEVTIEDIIPHKLYLQGLNSFYSKIKNDWKFIELQEVYKVKQNKFIDKIKEATEGISGFGGFDKVGVLREICLKLDDSNYENIFEEYKEHWTTIETIITKIKESFK